MYSLIFELVLVYIYDYDKIKHHTTTGLVIPFSCLAQSLYALIAKIMDSVPPLVITPHEVIGLPLKRLQHMRTISASIFRIPGKQSGCNGFDHADMP